VFAEVNRAWKSLLMKAGVICCVIAAGFSTRAADAPKVEKRRGWVSNPSPGNWSLIDKDGTWEIAVQGEEGALDGLPEDRPTGKRWWVSGKSGGYGYGCMCLRVSVDKQTMKVLKIDGGKSLPLSTCRRDRSIRKLEPR
jgi:hypothetical protein